MADIASNSMPVPPEQYILPHVKQFVAEFQTPAKTYRFTFDEARKRSHVDTLSMRRDGFIISRLQARYLPVLGAEWHVKSTGESGAKVDENGVVEDEIGKKYTELLKCTPRFLQLRKCLLEAVWYGRYGVQLKFGPVDCCGQQMTGITGWLPVNGDKITCTYEGDPAIRIASSFASQATAQGATVSQANKLHTSIGDVGHVLILDKPAWRQRFVIHVHEIEDADFNEPELAGGVNGVGLRHYCYWLWWLRQEIMEWLLSYLEMMGAGGLTIVGYDMSNPKGLEEAKAAFAERATVAYLPIPPGADKQSNIVQRLEPSGTGNDIFTAWIDGYFNAIMTQIIIGQNLSSQSDSTGLGSGVADLHADVKAQIHAYDAQNLDETISQQLLKTLVMLNEPRASVSLKYETVLQKRDPDKALAAAQTAFGMGAEVPESHVLDMANIPRPEKGEKVLSQANQQAQSAELSMMQGEPGEGEGWNNG